MTSAPDIVPDSERRGLIAAMPAATRPYLSLARVDRPIGVWLLFWPGAWAIALAGQAAARWDLLLWFLLGAFAMRSAGCVYNDIVDRDLDAKVARTRLRPLASGRVTLRAAWAWLVALCLAGLVVLLQLRPLAQAVALGSLALVAAYPFMKRIIWWPQAWLGLVFSWAARVGWPAAAGALPPPALLLYAGSVLWVIGYDTIYALQDVEDDALVG
ncbi:MAG: 4-hydroxybenzoate octaprenyltransferase, partial [Sphingomonas sp.]